MEKGESTVETQRQGFGSDMFCSYIVRSSSSQSDDMHPKSVALSLRVISNPQNPHLQMIAGSLKAFWGSEQGLAQARRSHLQLAFPGHPGDQPGLHSVLHQGQLV